MDQTIGLKLHLFESKYDLIIPDDLKNYFKTFKVKNYDSDMFAFYGFDDFKSVKDEVGDFGGIPDYTNIVNVLGNHESCFVFMEYFIHICVYAIRLYKNESDRNEIYVICGDKYEIVANSFKDFISLYREDINNVLLL